MGTHQEGHTHLSEQSLWETIEQQEEHGKEHLTGRQLLKEGTESRHNTCCHLTGIGAMALVSL